MLPMLAKIASLLPTHTRRSEESEALQQFSTPIALGLVACIAAGITPADRVLEPSAGTGLLAIFAELAGGTARAERVGREPRRPCSIICFPRLHVTRFDAAQIDDHLDVGIVPSVVLMNPPFSAMANVDRRMADAALRHVASALARLCDGGRLVAITGATFAPTIQRGPTPSSVCRNVGRVVFSAAIDGAVYAKHGTHTDTRLTVIDKQPAVDPTVFPVSPGMAPMSPHCSTGSSSTCLRRLPVAAPVAVDAIRRPAIATNGRRFCDASVVYSGGSPAPEGVRTRLRDGRLDARRKAAD